MERQRIRIQVEDNSQLQQSVFTRDVSLRVVQIGSLLLLRQLRLTETG